MTTPDNIHYYDNGSIHVECFYLRVDDNPTYIEYYESDNVNERGQIKALKYETTYVKRDDSCYRDRHRENDLPAKIKYYPDGHIQRESYYVYDEHERDNDKPCKIYYYPSELGGKVEKEIYYENCALSRSGDKPAIIEYYPNGNIKSETYYNLWQIHRDNDKPAEIYYYENGKIQIETYMQNDKCCRNDNSKPSHIVYSLDGDIQIEEYWAGNPYGHYKIEYLDHRMVEKHTIYDKNYNIISENFVDIGMELTKPCRN